MYHIDEGAVRALTNYYREAIPQGSSVLDICSSWVSHYPQDFPSTMKRISGTGMNALELEANNQLTDFKPKNLNIDPKLPYESKTFDVVRSFPSPPLWNPSHAATLLVITLPPVQVTCVVSVDYLIKPLEVFKEVHRVLKPGGKFILSQSNRCFPTKARTLFLRQLPHVLCLYPQTVPPPPTHHTRIYVPRVC